MIERIVELLGPVARRPGMYVHPVSVETVQAFLCGLEAGCKVAGLDLSREIYGQACEQRGWRYRADGVVSHMEEGGLTPDAIIQELIAIESLAFVLASAAQARGP